MSPRPSPASLASAEIEVVRATPDRWPDVMTVMGGNGDNGCWCQAPRGVARGYGRDAPGSRREALRSQLDDDPPAGLLAYVQGEVAGWIGFGRRPDLPRLVRSRTIPKVDDAPVWSILCFLIRVGYRRRGVARSLLDALIEDARRSGAPGLEAYPIDAEGGRVNGTFAFVGLTSMFEKAGFRRVVLTDAHSAGRPRWLMRLDFDDPAPAGSS